MFGTLSSESFLFIRSTPEKQLFFLTHGSATRSITSFTRTLKIGENC
jgi:hypothetical protein